MLIEGDCLERMRELAPCSVDSIVTDPPYGLSFMGRDWDHGVPGVAFWVEVLRVAKPGAHLLAFGGTRTYHRLACAIEDAGWEVRDCVGWLYGSGFPKSLDVSKAIDKVNGDGERLLKFVEWMRTTGLTAGQINAAIEKSDVGSHYLRRDQPAIPTRELWAKLRPLCGDVPAWVDELVERIEAEREVVGQKSSACFGDEERHTIGASAAKVVDITAPATSSARQWQGWGTALKPAWEPVIVARKPLESTVAANVLKHGTGAMNIDGCRVGAEAVTVNAFVDGMKPFGGGAGHEYESKTVIGRWPANIILSGDAEVEAIFPNDAARFFYCAKASRREREAGLEGMPERVAQRYSKQGQGPTPQQTPREHKPAANHHPTVKPIALMRYLCRLITPPGGVVLDPFMGSGTTGCAARLEGFDFIGIEREPEYMAIAEARIKHWDGEIAA